MTHVCQTSIVIDVRHQLLTTRIRETISQQQQLGQIIITVLFISTLGLHSQACQPVYRLSNYWFYDTKLVESFLSNGPHALTMYRSPHPLTHPVLQQYVVWYRSKAQHTVEKPIHQQPTNLPCVYNSTTAVVQQYSRKKKKAKKAGTGVFELAYLGLAGTKKKQQKQGGVFELTPCLSRIERSTAEPKGNIMIPCRLRGGNFEKSSLPEVSCCTDIFAYCLLQTMEEYSILRSTCLWFFLSR